MKQAKLTEIVGQFLQNTEAQQVVVKQCGSSQQLTMQDFRHALAQLNIRLTAQVADIDQHLVAIAIDPSANWILLDTHCIVSKTISVPIPTEFSDEQIAHLLEPVGYCFVDDFQVAKRIMAAAPKVGVIFSDGTLIKTTEKAPNAELLSRLQQQDVIKIIHTSGTTSAPKGVLIRDAGLGGLIETLAQVYQHLGPWHYYSMVPFSLLIEQVLAIYLPFSSGGSCTLLPSGILPFSTQSGMAGEYLESVRYANCNVLYLPPKLLEETLSILQRGEMSVADIFGSNQVHVVTGGAKVSAQLLIDLQAYGLEVDEGYGLSENSSVVAINTGVGKKLGSVGKLLSGLEARIEEGELLIKSPSLCAGYLNRDISACEFNDEGFLHTGDLAHFDEQGYLYIEGRIKNVIILSSGRNVSPEWVEATYKELDDVADVVVFGEAQESISGVVFTNKEMDEAQIQTALAQVASRLPTYCQIQQVRVQHLSESLRRRYFTVTGRPMRDKIVQDFFADIAA